MKGNIILCSDSPSIPINIVKFLEDRGYSVFLYEERPNLDTFIRVDPRFIISYSYSYIFKNAFIDRFRNRIINMHLSILPYNKGYRPTVWNLICGTPIGVSIHLVDEGIDTGPIIAQDYVEIDENLDTLRTSWLKHHFVVQRLFMLRWGEIEEGRIKTTPQKGKGNYNSKEKFRRWIEPIIDMHGWDIKTYKFLEILKKSGLDIKKLCFQIR